MPSRLKMVETYRIRLWQLGQHSTSRPSPLFMSSAQEEFRLFRRCVSVSVSLGRRWGRWPKRTTRSRPEAFFARSPW